MRTGSAARATLPKTVGDAEEDPFRYLLDVEPVQRANLTTMSIAPFRAQVKNRKFAGPLKNIATMSP